VITIVFALLSTIAASSLSPPQAPAGPVMAATIPEYERVKEYLLRSAEQMPEEHYTFKPTLAVRSFGQIVGHVAATQYVFCAAARNELNPQSEEFEKTRTAKARLVEALRASFEYCDSAYKMTDAQATSMIKIPNWGERAPLSILVLNISHDSEHYGNFVTYLRLKGLVPPSSQPGK
jgi:uncharacterized damage-inducible protein DinB